MPSSGMIAARIGRPPPERPESERTAGLQAHREQSPWRYAASSVPGARSAPTPAISAPSAICAGAGQRPAARRRLDRHACTLPNRSDLRLRGSSGPLPTRGGGLASVTGCRSSVDRVRARSYRGARGAVRHRRRRARAVRTTRRPSSNASDAARAGRRARRPKYFAALERVSVARRRHRAQRTTRRRLLDARARQARAAARARARIAYTSSGTQLVDARRRQRHARRRASRAPHRPRERARPGRLRRSCTKRRAQLRKQQRELRDTARPRPTRSTTLKDQGAAIDAKLAQAVATGAGAGRGRGRPPRPGRSRRRHHRRPIGRGPAPPPRPPPTTTTHGARAEHAAPAARLLGHPGRQPAPRRPLPHLRPPA